MIVESPLKTIATQPTTATKTATLESATPSDAPQAKGFMDELNALTKTKKVESQADTAKITSTQPDTNEPNTAVERHVGITTFIDGLPTTFELQPANNCPVHELNAPDVEANSIESIMNRPTFMNQVTWDSTQVAGTLLATYEVPNAIINLSTLKQQKVQYNQFLNCDMVLRIQASPIQLQAGRLWLCFEPYRVGRGARASTGEAIQFTALHGVSYDPCQPTPMELRIPFSSILSSWELTSAQFGCGSVLLYVLSPLASASATNSMTIAIQGWLENTKVRVPTAAVYQAPAATVSAAMVYQSREVSKAQDQKYSQFFSRLSRTATAASYFPLLSSVAQPVAFFSDMASNFASYFGFSKPADISAPMRVFNHNRSNWTNADGALPLTKLATSCENAIDQMGNHFPNPIDEMDISYIVANPVMINQWSWSTADTPGKLITVLPVHPGLCKIFDDESNNTYTFGSYATSPTSYVASMFKYWAGSMKFKLEAVATPFHAGRLVLAYVPNYSPLDLGVTIQDIGNNYSVVWDIADSTHIEFEVPYLGNTPFLDVFLDNQTFKKITDGETDARTVRDRIRKTMNGAIIVFVLNSLVAPSVASSSISVLNWVAGGKDLTFAEPVLGAYKPVRKNAKRIDYTGKWYSKSDMSAAPVTVLPSGASTAFTYQSNSEFYQEPLEPTGLLQIRKDGANVHVEIHPDVLDEVAAYNNKGLLLRAIRCYARYMLENFLYHEESERIDIEMKRMANLEMKYQSAPDYTPVGVDPKGSTSRQMGQFKNFMPVHYIDPKSRARMACGEVVTNLRVLTRRLTPVYQMYPQGVSTAGAWGTSAAPPTSNNVLVFDPDYFGTADGQGDQSLYGKQIAPAVSGNTNWLTELDSALAYVSQLYAFARGSRIYAISSKPNNVINSTAYGTLSDEINKPGDKATFEFRLTSINEEDTPPRQPYFRPEDYLIGYDYANKASTSLSNSNYTYGFNSCLQGNFAVEKSGESGVALAIQVPPTSRYPFRVLSTANDTEEEVIKRDTYSVPRSRRFVELRYRPFSSVLSGGTATYTPKIWPFPTTILEAGADDFSFGGLIPPPIITKVAKTNSFPKYSTGGKVLL